MPAAVVLPPDGGRLLRRLLPPTVWQLRTLWVWNLDNGGPTSLDYLASKAGAVADGWQAVAVKVHDGADMFGGAQHLTTGDYQTMLARIRASGIRAILGWGWLRGDGEDGRSTGYVELEAARAAERCRTLRLDGYAADPESVYEFSPRDSPYPHAGNLRFGYSRRFVRSFATAIRSSSFPRAVASFGRVDLHDLDWQAWASRGPDGTVWRCVPQAYWNESAALEPELCVEAALRYWRRELVHPLCGCYPGHDPQPSPAAYQESLRRSGTLGYGFYVADSMTAAQARSCARLGGVSR